MSIEVRFQDRIIAASKDMTIYGKGIGMMSGMGYYPITHKDFFKGEYMSKDELDELEPSSVIYQRLETAYNNKLSELVKTVDVQNTELNILRRENEKLRFKIVNLTCVVRTINEMIFKIMGLLDEKMLEVGVDEHTK